MRCCCCSSVSTVELQKVIDEVEGQEKAGSIQPLLEDDTPTSILEAEPEAGQIVSRKEYPVLGAVELTLSNGMKVEDALAAAFLVAHGCARVWSPTDALNAVHDNTH